MFRIWGLTTGTGVAEKWLTGNFLRTNQRRFFMVEGNGGRGRELTDFGTCIGQAVVKVRFRAILGDYRLYLLRVVDLPDDGLPTSPMRGSRGIARSSQVIPEQRMWIARKSCPYEIETRRSSSAERCSCYKYFAMNLF